MGLLATFRTIKRAFDRRSPNLREEVNWPEEASTEKDLVYGPNGEFVGTLVAGYLLLDPADVRAGVDIGDGTLGAMSVNTVSGYVVSGVGGVGVVSGT